MLKNAYLDGKIGFDPAENEPPQECCTCGAGFLLRDTSNATPEEKAAEAAAAAAVAKEKAAEAAELRASRARLEAEVSKC